MAKRKIKPSKIKIELQPAPRDWVVDPVCRRSLNPRDAVGTAEFRDQAYAFCSRACLGQFEAQPEKFLG